MRNVSVVTGSLLLAGALLAHEGEASRLDVIEAALAAHPESIALRVERAQALHRLHRDDAAIAQLDDAMKRAPSNPDVLRLRALVLHALHRDAEAELAADAFLDGNPPTDDVLMVRAEVLALRGDHARAAQDAEEAARLHATPDAFLTWGRMLANAGSRRDSARAYQLGIDKLGDSVVLRTALVEALLDGKDGAAAVDAMGPLMRSPSPDVLLLHARAAELAGLPGLAHVDRITALELVNMQLDRRPSALAHLVKARVLDALSRRQEAILEAHQALALAPRWDEAKRAVDELEAIPRQP